jgi:hypothetical protein
MTVLPSRFSSHSLPLNGLYYGNIKCIPHSPANTLPYFNPPLNIETNFKEDTHNTATFICNTLQSCPDPSAMYVRRVVFPRGNALCSVLMDTTSRHYDNKSPKDPLIFIARYLFASQPLYKATWRTIKRITAKVSSVQNKL